MRWDLIDRFEILRKGEYATAVKSFSGKEDFFSEHYSQRPLVPEPLFIEMIAQAGGVLLGLGLDFKQEVIFAKIAHAHFESEVAPPCECHVEARMKEQREEGAWIAGSVSVNKKVVANAEIFLAAIPLLQTGGQKSVVFNESFLNHFNIYRVAQMSEEVS